MSMKRSKDLKIFEGSCFAEFRICPSLQEGSFRAALLLMPAGLTSFGPEFGGSGCSLFNFLLVISEI